jgi:hypothetical protein
MKAIRFFLTIGVLISPAAGIHASEGPNPWPGLAEDAPCLTEQWPTARTLVWTRPGESGTALEPANWTEYASAEDYAAGREGQPAEVGPDESTDLVLPDAPAGQSYVVGYMVASQYPKPVWPPAMSCRHVTIGAGAALDGGIGVSRGQLRHSNWLGHDRAAAINGNVTVRDGGYVYGHLYFVGDKDTWFSIGRCPEPLGHSLNVRKAHRASVTCMARQYDLVAGVTVESGRLVLGPGTGVRINATCQARIDLKKLNSYGAWMYRPYEPYVWVHDGAALDMQAGSRIGRVHPPDDIAADVRIEGLLQIGQVAGSDDAPAVIELTMAEGDGTFLNQPGGLYIGPAAEVRNPGALTITAKDPDSATATKGVSLFLENEVDLGKAKIDCLRAGGIAATDPAAAKKGLALATFGGHCAATGDARYSKIELIDFPGGWGTVEFVDGLSTECEVLFPLGDRLIVRSQGNRICQSFDLDSIHAVEIDGRRTEYRPPRTLSAGEQRLRQVNALWADIPGDGQIGNYGKQDWSKRPLMVWRRPGKTGSRFVAANWLDEAGRPYFELPIGVDQGPESPDADILLPAADDFYQVVADRPPWAIRHMTIEDNAHFFLTYNVSGNMWMKDGSGKQAPWFGKYTNTKPGVHRFLRFDGMRIRRPHRAGEAPQRLDAADCTISQWGCYQTGPGGTLELIGTNRVNDQFRIAGEGKLIISEGSYLAPGPRACFAIQPEATVVLLQDARISLETTATQLGKASVWVGGTLMIGTPRRPITRDMLFPVTGIEDKFINRHPAGNIRTPGVSLLVGKEGRLVMHTADPIKARLVFKMHDSERAREQGKRWGDPDGIVLDFEGTTELNGVVFDNVLEAGIMVSPEQRATWKNVSYGEHNLAEPDRLYYDLQPSAE